MIDGIWWLVILLAVIVALWIIAKSRTVEQADNKKTTSALSATIPNNDALQKTLKVVKQHFPDYRVTRRGSHLLISKQGVKVAMITIDKKMAVSQRRLGEVPIINYHRVPSRAQLSANLQETKQSS